ncbi:hypothetical protein DPMN_059124 [Dreissena polymorpha]|uniref:Uncharacterized protein n=1 Tax=Dreissena polymorpha TaxID=45954 RepID=A0A9D4HEL9_DREPO|nr:hypothetical protein DPMN_059124 [Dreissena polymorpha]
MADIHLVRHRRPRKFRQIDRQETDLTDDEPSLQRPTRRNKALTKPINNPAESRAPVFVGNAPMEPVTPSALTGAITASDAGRDTAMPRRSPGEWRWRPDRAPIYRDSAGIHRGSIWAPPAWSYGAVPVVTGSSCEPQLTHRGSTGIILCKTLVVAEPTINEL